MSRYPHRAGYTAGDTDKEAADMMENTGKAATLRRKVIALHRQHPDGLTADEASEMLGEIEGSIRPRFSEFKKRNILIMTDKKRPSMNGNSQRVLKLNPEWDGTNIDPPKKKNQKEELRNLLNEALTILENDLLYLQDAGKIRAKLAEIS